MIIQHLNNHIITMIIIFKKTSGELAQWYWLGGRFVSLQEFCRFGLQSVQSADGKSLVYGYGMWDSSRG